MNVVSTIGPASPLCTNGFFLLVWCNKLWMVHCIYWGVTGYHFHIRIVFLSQKIIFVLANSVNSDEMLQKSSGTLLLARVHIYESPVYIHICKFSTYPPWPIHSLVTLLNYNYLPWNPLNSLTYFCIAYDV